MTRPRPVYPGQTVLTAKRCIRGEYLLRPDPEIVQGYLYCLAMYSGNYGTLLHDFMGLSNHDHPLFTDPEANGPAFLRDLHSVSARYINAHFGESDSVFSGQRPGVVRLLDADAVLRKCMYVLLNPVKAGLVRYAWDWEGPTSWHMEYGVPITIKKPSFFFSKNMPDEVQLVIHRPEGLFPGMTDREARAELRRRVREEQGKLIAERLQEGKTFLGMKRVRRLPRHSSPSKQPARGGIRPHVASKNRQARVAALTELSNFWTDHEIARRAFEAGKHDTVFPPGTYLMRVRFAVPIRAP